MTRHLTKRGQWFSMLAKLTSPMESTLAAQAFGAYGPMLESFPDEAFTIDSLEHVAANCRHGVPTYADLREHLGAWWRENRPPPATPAIGEDTGLDENARLWVKYFRTREAEGFCPLANGHPSSRAHVLSLVKARSTTAWQYLTGETSHPERPTTPRRRGPTTDELEAVGSIVSRGIEAINAHYASVYHPPNSPTAPARPEPRYLSTAELTAARQAIGAPPPKATA